MHDYNLVLLQAIQKTLDDYQNRRIRFVSEADLQSHVFYWCRRIMEETNYPEPLKLFVLRSVLEKRRKVDLVLGEDEVLVEMKMEPKYPGVSKPVVFSTRREAQGASSVEEDLEKISSYSALGKHAHFLMIDEDGRHRKRVEAEWKDIKGLDRPAYYLHRYESPKLAR